MSEVNVPASAGWVRRYAFIRFGFSAAWVALAFAIGRDNPAVAAVLLVIYPAWDAVANVVDARRNGGLGRNPTHALNVVVSAVTTLAVAWALGQGITTVVFVYGLWAILSGLLQLATAIRRWSAGGQWAMVLSGAQSALAGAFFVFSANTMADPGIGLIAGYAGFGAVYFLVSALWLTFRAGGRGAR